MERFEDRREHGIEADEEVPPRGSATFLATAPESHLWMPIEESDRRAIVGLKAPTAARGVWRGTVLLDDAELGRAKADLVSVAGVEILDEDETLPAVLVRVESPEALSVLRSREHIDYIDPANLPGLFGAADPVAESGPGWKDPPGCTGMSRPWGGFVYGGPVDRLPGGQILPLNYKYSSIEGAWHRGANGAGITVGVLDTGVFRSQLQLRTAEQVNGGLFNRGESREDRWVKQL
jgi:hypothetical protein